MKTYRSAPLALILVSTLIAVTGCGGGGGGGEGSDTTDLAARVYLSLSSGTIDTGDRISVSVLVEEVNPDGAAIKVRFPIGLKYILATSELEIDGQVIESAPTTSVSDETNSYLVYYLRQSQVGEGSATLTFKLLGVKAVAKGKGTIGVDADVDDPAVDNQDEFQVATPNFAAEDSEKIEVKA